MNELDVLETEIRELVTGYHGGGLGLTCRELVRANKGQKVRPRRPEDLANLKAWLYCVECLMPERALNAKAVAALIRESVSRINPAHLPTAIPVALAA